MRTHAMALAFAAGKPQDSAELGRMIQEKLMATAEAGLAVQTEIARQATAAWWGMTLGRRPTLSAAGMKRLSGKAAAPYAKRVRGNSRRLTRSKG
ncbi:hypothetical protein [Amorphus orientalis]|uniref:Uncharacterized protein n=1 Tax=Amorphus orientalis TaxID=649198 RepID=A0AAE4AVR5_9HYPH|nr:hypothetical protein [Amorphus orientalis]MDQ0316949.1 hypothetical protein [Amorphus orientalis]